MWVTDVPKELWNGKQKVLKITNKDYTTLLDRFSDWTDTDKIDSCHLCDACTGCYHCKLRNLKHCEEAAVILAGITSVTELLDAETKKQYQEICTKMTAWLKTWRQV